MKNKIQNGLLVIVLAAIPVKCTYSIIMQGAHERAWRAAAHLADKKGDDNGVISNKEYASIYHALNLTAQENPSFENGGYALELSTEQLKKYVSENQ